MLKTLNIGVLAKLNIRGSFGAALRPTAQLLGLRGPDIREHGMEACSGFQVFTTQPCFVTSRQGRLMRPHSSTQATYGRSFRGARSHNGARRGISISSDALQQASSCLCDVNCLIEIPRPACAGLGMTRKGGGGLGMTQGNYPVYAPPVPRLHYTGELLTHLQS